MTSKHPQDLVKTQQKQPDFVINATTPLLKPQRKPCNFCACFKPICRWLIAHQDAIYDNLNLIISFFDIITVQFASSAFKISIYHCGCFFF